MKNTKTRLKGVSPPNAPKKKFRPEKRWLRVQIFCKGGMQGQIQNENESKKHCSQLEKISLINGPLNIFTFSSQYFFRSIKRQFFCNSRVMGVSNSFLLKSQSDIPKSVKVKFWRKFLCRTNSSSYGQK